MRPIQHAILPDDSLRTLNLQAETGLLVTSLQTAEALIGPHALSGVISLQKAASSQRTIQIPKNISLPHLVLESEALFTQQSVETTQGILEEAVQFARQHQSLAAPLLVHCYTGMRRSSTVALAILADRMGPGYENEAIATWYIQELGNTACPKVNIAAVDTYLERDGTLLKAWQDCSLICDALGLTNLTASDQFLGLLQANLLGHVTSPVLKTEIEKNGTEIGITALSQLGTLLPTPNGLVTCTATTAEQQAAWNDQNIPVPATIVYLFMNWRDNGLLRLRNHDQAAAVPCTPVGLTTPVAGNLVPA
jgi:predicted protein tyrosine phosphatase